MTAANQSWHVQSKSYDSFFGKQLSNDVDLHNEPEAKHITHLIEIMTPHPLNWALFLAIIPLQNLSSAKRCSVKRP